MLLILDDSLQIYPNEEDRCSADVLTSFNNIGIGRCEGKHAVFGSRDIIGVLSDWDALNPRSKTAFLHDFNRLSEKKTLADKLERVIRILPEDVSPQVIVDGSRKQIQLPVTFFSDTTAIQRVQLLTENRDDAEYYEIVANSHAASIGLGRLPIRFSFLGGGGSSLAQQYDYLQKQGNQFCVAVADSDRFSPAGSLGSTAKVAQAADDADVVTCELIITQGRELENTIPTTFYSDASMHAHQIRDVERLERLEQSKISSIRFHLDLKNGTRLEDILKLQAGTPDHQFWHSKIGSLLALYPDVKRECAESGQCRAADECSCPIVGGFGDGIISEVLGCLNRLSPHRIAKRSANTVCCDWDENIGPALLAWGCGSEKLNST